MKKCLALLLVFHSLLLPAQQHKLDSLQKLFDKANTDSTRAKLLLAQEQVLGKMGKTNAAIDKLVQSLTLSRKSGYKMGEISALEGLGADYEFLGNYSEGLKYLEEALKLSQEMHSSEDEAYTYINMGNIYMDEGQYPQSLAAYNQALGAAESAKDKKSIAICHGNRGNIYSFQGNYTDALKEFLTALKLNEEINYKPGIAHHLGTVGGVYYYQGNLPVALEYYQKALAVLESIGARDKMGPILTNCGVIHRQQNKPEEAFKDYRKAFEIEKARGDKRAMSETYNHLGILNSSLARYPEALEDYQKSLALEEELQDVSGQADTRSELADAERKMGRLGDALNDFNKALSQAQKLGSKETIKNIYSGLSDLYAAQKNFEKAYSCYKLSTQFKDSMVNDENNKQMAQMNALYQSEKKDREIQMNEYELKKQKAETEKQASQHRVVVISFILVGIVAVFVLVFALYVLKNYREKQKAYGIIAKQKALVDEKNKDITDSINYAKRIQDAALPSEQLREKLFPESFILFQPKDIVSGDFYWFAEKKGKCIIAAVDCTGHGVPGAFMSMIGNAFLNELVNERGITQPSLILDGLRELIIASLKQSDGSNQDGMDIALLSYDPQSRKAEYAGANNPLWRISDENGSPVFTEVKADKQPLGVYKGVHTPFHNHCFDLRKGDQVYLFTDGYADQFGGPSGKKFKYKRMQDLITSRASLKPSEQKDLLSAELNAWKGELEQVDDILVIGIKV